jgi:hypothetical protein
MSSSRPECAMELSGDPPRGTASDSSSDHSGAVPLRVMSLAQRRLIVTSQGRQSTVWSTSLNHCSSCLRLRPCGSERIPTHSSPTITESTARFRSLAVNQSMTLLLGTGFVGSLSTLHRPGYNHQSLGTFMWSMVPLRSIGLNQPFTGQASSSLTRPSLRRRSLRFSPYSPRSMRSTSNPWPTPRC